MYKLKIHSGASKRFKITASGKIKRKKAFKNHILSCKTKKQKRHLSKKAIVNSTDMYRVSNMLCI